MLPPVVAQKNRLATDLQAVFREFRAYKAKYRRYLGYFDFKTPKTAGIQVFFTSNG